MKRISLTGSTGRNNGGNDRHGGIGLDALQRVLVYGLVLVTPFSIYPAIVYQGRGLKPFHFVAGLIVFLGLLRFLRGEWFSLNTVTGWMLGFYSAASASVVGLWVYGGSWSGFVDYVTLWLQLTLAVMLVLCVSMIEFRSRHLRRLLGCLLLITILVSVYGIYQSFARMMDWPFAYLEILNPSLAHRPGQGGGELGAFRRASSFFTEPSRLCGFLLAPLLLTLFWFSSLERGRIERLGMIVVFFVSIMAFIMGFSMGGYVGLLAALAFGFLIRPFRWLSPQVILAGTLGILLTSLALIPVLDTFFLKLVGYRFMAHLQPFLPIEGYIQSPLTKSSLNVRMDRYAAALRVWWEHPVLGVGLNNFGRFYPEGMQARVHSAYFQAMAEMGIAGGILLVLFVWRSGRRLLEVAEKPWLHPRERALFLAVGLAILGRGVWMIGALGYLIEFFWLDMVLAAVLLRYYWYRRAEET